MNTQVVANDFEEYQRVRDLIEKTHKENPTAKDRAALRHALEESPKLWRWAGDVARVALDQVVMEHHEGSVYMIESLQRGLTVMRQELGYETAPLLERLLIEQILICWLRLNLLEAWHLKKTTESHTSEIGLYWDRRLSNAQRRLTRATESLAKVRKLTAEMQKHQRGMTQQSGPVLKALTA